MLTDIKVPKLYASIWHNNYRTKEGPKQATRTALTQALWALVKILDFKTREKNGFSGRLEVSGVQYGKPPTWNSRAKEDLSSSSLPLLVYRLQISVTSHTLRLKSQPFLSDWLITVTKSR